jgi:uncharacterized protein (TIGR02569 family)
MSEHDAGQGSTSAAPPPPAVLAAFGASSTPVHLAGGRGSSWRSGELVLKPVHDTAEATWCSPLLADLEHDGFRVPRPRPTRSGTWTLDGWAASGWVEGTADLTGHWPDLVAATAAFHRALETYPRPSSVDGRSHWWAVADRAVWEGASPGLIEELAPVHDRLRALSRSEDGDHPSQLVHGDLAGNVLFHPGLPPAIIDFSPYWRPAPYALAIAVADELLAGSTDPAVVESVGIDVTLPSSRAVPCSAPTS